MPKQGLIQTFSGLPWWVLPEVGDPSRFSQIPLDPPLEKGEEWVSSSSPPFLKGGRGDFRGKPEAALLVTDV